MPTDTISAFIKSLRGSDPDAALYWLARMVYAGEDPRFIFRRMLILASEDVGLADPKQLWLLMPVLKHLTVGIPEGRYHLAGNALSGNCTQVKQRHGLFSMLWLLLSGNVRRRFQLT